MFDQIKANLVEIQPEKRQNVQKTRFLPKAPGFNGLMPLKLLKNELSTPRADRVLPDFLPLPQLFEGWITLLTG